MVGHTTGAWNDFEVEPVTQLVGRFPESHPGSEFDLRDHHMHGVDEVGVQELPDRGGPAAEPDVLALGRIPRLIEDRCGVGVDEVERGVAEGERRTGVGGQQETVKFWTLSS